MWWLLPILAAVFVLGLIPMVLYWNRHPWIRLIYGGALFLVSALAVPWFWRALLESGKTLEMILSRYSSAMLTLLLMELAGVALLGGALFRLGKGKHNG